MYILLLQYILFTLRIDLRKALQEMGEKVSEEELRELIAEVDINKNGNIEEEEFLQVGLFYSLQRTTITVSLL